MAYNTYVILDADAFAIAFPDYSRGDARTSRDGTKVLIELREAELEALATVKSNTLMLSHGEAIEYLAEHADEWMPDADEAPKPQKRKPKTTERHESKEV